MKRINLERLKFYVLVALIMTSIIQVGILWTYQDYGFPINFFGKKANANSNFNENEAKSLIDPFRIIVSEGSGDVGKDEPSRWILSDNKESDYIMFWDEAKQQLKNCLTAGQKPTISDYKDWASVVLSEKSLIFDFKTRVNQGLLLWLLDVNKISENIPVDIQKIILAPWQNTGMLYITDGTSIYSYSLGFEEEKLKAYEDIFNKYGESDNGSFRKYSFIKELSPQKPIKNFSEDTLVIIKGGQYSSIKSVRSAIPTAIHTEKAYSQNQVEDIANTLLGAEKDGYDRTVDGSKNTIEFKTQNKIYELNNRGDLEYKFLTDIQQADKGELKDAIINSYQLLSKIKSLISKDSNLYLTKIMENSKGSYILKFDYIVDGVPVVFASNDYGSIESAITIESNRKGILNCSARLKNFVPGKSEGVYNVYFGDLQVDLYKKYEDLKNNSNVIVKQLMISYNVTENSTQNEPIWVLETDNKVYTIPMRAK